MIEKPVPIKILIADDDSEDSMMIKEAFQEGHLANNISFVEDGEELMDYLQHKGKYSDPSSAPLPGLILLDLNMPRKDGREALQEIKADVKLKSIPVVILTTSKAEEDVLRSYNLGVNSFITKPVTFAALCEVVQTIEKYWFEIVVLPQKQEYQNE